MPIDHPNLDNSWDSFTRVCQVDNTNHHTVTVKNISRLATIILTSRREWLLIFLNLINFLPVAIHMPWYVGGGSKTNLWESVFSFHHVGFWDQIQIIRLSNKISYTLSYFASLKTCWEWKFPLFVASRRGSLLVTLFSCTSCLLFLGLRKGQSHIHLLVIPHLHWVCSRLTVLFHLSRLSPRSCFWQTANCEVKDIVPFVYF